MDVGRVIAMAADADDYSSSFSLLESLASGIVDMFGPNCEVVVHDFSKEGDSIVAISGNVTGRHIGGSMSKIGLQIRAFGDDAQASYLYITRLPDGRVVRSSTIVLRSDGKVFGAFCINYEITGIDAAATALSHLRSVPMSDIPTTERTPLAEDVSQVLHDITFADDVGQVLHELITEEMRAIPLVNGRLRKPERLQLLRVLKRKGAFTLQRAVPQVAEHLGVSRATIYTDLHNLRSQDD
jgi:predicted transcriptional regulator YheO